MDKTCTIILGGGAGSRLYPLTKFRAKPAVPLAGKYRLIDVAISNAINSGLRHIFVLTQYLSASLNRHVAQTYTFDIFTGGFVEILAAEQGHDGGNWYQGTADAIRKQWHTFSFPHEDLILVLPGDALYHIDYRPMIQQHRDSGAEVSLAVNTVGRARAHHFGLLKLDTDNFISEFREKPKDDAAMKGMEASPEMLRQFGGRFDGGNTFLASMGVYIFNRSALEYYMQKTDFLDFGKQIIPDALTRFKCAGFIFPGYWEDIGTIDAFFEAHMAMLSDNPPFRFASQGRPIFTRPRFLPNVHAKLCNLENSRIAEGSVMEGATVRDSFIGLRSFLRNGTVVERCVLMGNDYYEEKPAPGTTLLGVGERSVIKNAIIDKNVRIGKGVKILNIGDIQEIDTELYSIRDGIVIVPKNTTIPDGMVI